MQDWTQYEGKTGTLPDGTRIVVSGGRPVPLKEGKMPEAYRKRTDGGIEAIPGSEDAVKAQRRTDSNMSRGETATGMLETVRSAKGDVGWGESGMVGSVMSHVPGTKAFDVNKRLDTLRANLSFDKLQEMRDNSPTGGALGNVTERELELLSSVVASLDMGQSEDQLEKNLGTIESKYSNLRQRLGYNDQFKIPAGGSRGQPNPRARPARSRATPGDIGSMSDDQIKRALGL